MRRILQSLMVLVVGIFPAMSFSQVATGTPPFSSITGGPDAINLANLNVHWDFPILSKAGRGLPFNYSLKYDGSIWTVGTVNGQQTWQPVGGTSTTWGWQQQSSALTGFVNFSITYVSCGNSFGNLYNNWVYYDPSGTAHSFGGYGVYSYSCNSSGYVNSATLSSNDGSGYQIAVDGNLQVTVYRPSGETIKAPLRTQNGNGTVTDSNGNYISTTVSGSQTTVTDTLGATALTINGPYPATYTYTAPNGNNATVTVNYATYTVGTNFGVPGISEYKGVGYLVGSIIYPDGSMYSFNYETTPTTPSSGVCTPIAGTYANNCVTGRLASVTLPTGGSISYRYNGGSNGIFGDGTTAGFYRDVYDGTNTNTWLYYLSGSGLTTMYDPQNNETLINFTGTYETQRQVWQGPSSAGQGLETILTCWNGVSSGTCGPGATVTPPIQNRVQYTQLPNTASRHDDYFDGSSNLTETDDYDWGYTLLRKRLITYASLGNNILDRPASVVVQDGNANVLSQTNYYYDQWALWTPPGTTQQHVAVSGARGNLTEMQISTGSSWLYHNFDYYDTGKVHDNRDVNGQPTYFNYADATSTCDNAFPTSVTPPQGSAGVDLTSYTTWNCVGAVPASTTDANVQSTTTVWNDSYFWRPYSVTDPAGYVSYTNYGSPNGWNTPPTWSDTYGEFNNNASMLDNYTLRDGLGRPKVSQKRQGPYQSVFSFDSVETDYDADGRPYSVSMPYVAGQNQLAPTGTPVKTTTYDAMGRPLHVVDAGGGTVDYNYDNNDVLITAGSPNKQTQYEYDVLGRLTSVCELTSAANGGGTCGQLRTQTGYWTKYTYDTVTINSVIYTRMTVTQNAQAASGPQQTRTFVYDALGRMVTESNPETGTVSYFYDSDTTCGQNSAGDLVRRVDAMGQYTCFSYDALHRQTGRVSYTSSGSLIKGAGFIYDAATVNGQSMSNAKGRLAHAYTCVSCWTPLQMITDLAFSYSPRGEASDVYELTPHSGGYYHATASYWPHGMLQNLNLKAANNTQLIPTISYGASDGSGLDGEGRVTKVTNSGTGPTPVAGVSYNNIDPGTSNEPLGALLSVNFGTTTSGQYDSDSFTYDRNTGRLYSYVFHVNNQIDWGNLTWNANGSLQQLQIIDNITGTIGAVDNQTCTYTYDDLGRIATANCGPYQNQTFSYDPFGNITKTASAGVGNFIVGYNQATNRINQSGYVYDNGAANSNGNLTSDTFHNYSWDAEGHATCIDGIVLIYDAMGRMVEQAAGGACTSPGTNYQQIVYGPGGGKLALMNIQTLNKAFVPLPGGATAVYNSAGLQYYRHSDWLGNSRLASTPARTPYSIAAYAPFGEPYDETGTQDRSFTGQNQDTVNGLYDFMYREQSPIQGRWISPDPAGLGAVDPTNPQSWNRYAYVMNNPLLLTDPLGLDPPKDPCKGIPNCVNVNDTPDPIETEMAELVFYGRNASYWLSNPRGLWELWKQHFDSGFFGPIDIHVFSKPGIEATARKIGSYIPTPCGGGVFNYAGVTTLTPVVTVAVAKWHQFDSRDGYSDGIFIEGSGGEVVTGGYGQQGKLGGPQEHYGFFGVGGKLWIANLNFS